jgi:hypothetical protein
MELYLDDSGSRLPDLHPAPERTGAMDCFALGGVLFEARNIPAILSAYKSLCEKWDINYPLHSNDIRIKRGKFAWVGTLDEGRKNEFFHDIDQMIERQPLVTTACVIHRPGYNARYKPTYGESRWRLSKTAYAIIVERAAKFALSKRLPLRVNFETAGKRENRLIIAYQRDLKKTGMPFATDNSSKFNPLDAEALRNVLLGDPEQHNKTSRFCQLADLVLYPMAGGKYDPEYRPYRHLKSVNKLIDCVIQPEEAETMGIKYSCFDSGWCT